MMRLSLFMLLATSSSAFTTKNVCTPRQQSLAPLNVGAALDLNDWKDDESFLMQVARNCANSDECSLEEAQVCLDNVIRIQSDCSSGTLIGSDVCEEVTVAADIVSNLRNKIDLQTKQLAAIAAGKNAMTVSVALFFLAVSVTTMTHIDPAAAPFTLQEWWWSVRDGYFPLMLKEFYQNGGFATDNYSPEVTSFTMQEMWWALKGGYMNELVSHYFNNGGLLTGQEQIASATPFTLQEWGFAMKGGFSDQMLAQTFENGGLTDVSDVDTLPVTPQEWVWAAQGGYLDTLVKSYVQKGGL